MRSWRPIYTFRNGEMLKLIYLLCKSEYSSPKITRLHKHRAPNIQTPKTAKLPLTCCHACADQLEFIAALPPRFLLQLEEAPLEMPKPLYFMWASKQRAVKCHFLVNNLFHRPIPYPGFASMCTQV